MNEETRPVKIQDLKVFAIFAAIATFAFLTSYVLSSRVERGDVSTPTETATKIFPAISLTAKAAYVYDVRTKTVLFSKNADLRLPLASITKLMSALVAEDASPLYGTVTVENEALKSDGDTGLYKNEKWSLKRLLDFSLMTSSNDGIRAVALSLGALYSSNISPEKIISSFVNEMNRKASSLGLRNTYFLNETGLDVKPEVEGGDSKGGAYGTARDISTLFEYILANHPELFEATRESKTTFISLDSREHVATNTNEIISEIPGILASKTGYTDTAGGNLAIIFDPELGRPIVITVLGSTENGRFSDIKTLVSATMEYIK